MGQRAFVKNGRATDTLRPTRLHIDVPLVIIVLILLVYGLLILYSASWDFAKMQLGKNPASIFNRQLLSTGVGILVGVIASVFDYRKYKPFLVPGIGVVVALLILTLFTNKDSDSVVRTLIGTSLLPAEIAKLGIIIYLSYWLSLRSERLKNASLGLIPMISILGLVGALIVLLPDYSAAATVVVLGGLLFFMAGGEWRQIALVMFLTIVLIAGVALSPLGKERFGDWWAGLKDPTQSSDQINSSLFAMVKGGVFGVGFGNSQVKYLGLPLPHSDSIFAVLVEETGFVGAFITIVLFGLLGWRGLVISQRAPDKTGALLAGGLSFWIVLEATINMLVIVGLFPVAGNSLPFFSAGGTSMVTNLTAIGIILNVARNSVDQATIEEGKVFSAVVNLRRWDWRRRVSRPGRPSGTRR
jgi:cell division protein FtsW